MGFFNKLFGKKAKTDSPASDERGKFMPEEKIPVDELFAKNFIENGGKFLYCPTIDNVFEYFKAILLENNWDTQTILYFNNDLKEQFKSFNIKEPETKNPSFFLTTCESLIADKGSILFTSNQIKEQKIHDLPTNFVLFATTSQLKESISDGLKHIKSNNSNIPSNITTLKCFKVSEEKDFLSYGSSSKNLYLLLLEDLL